MTPEQITGLAQGQRLEIVVMIMLAFIIYRLLELGAKYILPQKRNGKWIKPAGDHTAQSVSADIAAMAVHIDKLSRDLSDYCKENGEKINEIKERTQQIFDMHNERDPDTGAYRWWVPKAPFTEIKDKLDQLLAKKD